MMPTDHEALARQCEEAGADQQRGLCEAAFAVLIVRPYLGSQAASDTKPLRTRSYFFNRKLDAEAYLDAALMLLPEGWRPYTADMSTRDRSRFLLEGPKTQWAEDENGDRCAGSDWYSQGVAATPALALLAAILRAQGGKDAD